jgi:HD superfamily phosphohydrolase YqeK
VIELAAQGELPEWAEMTQSRRAHVSRVAAVMDEWAERAGLDEAGRMRWRAAGWLHDVLRDAPAEHMRPWLEGEFHQLPESFLHGPAAASRLSEEGVDDGELLDAIRYHTLGNAKLGRLGLSLIAADFLEPGRRKRAEWRSKLREQANTDFPAVIRTVVSAKLTHALEEEMPLRLEMAGLWNRLVRDEAS